MTIKKFRDVDFINRDIECEFFLNYFKNKPERVLWVYGPKSTGRTTLIGYILENRLNSKEYNIKYLNFRKILISSFDNFIESLIEEKDEDKTQTELNRNYNFFGLFKLEAKTLKKIEENRKNIFIIEEIQSLQDFYINGDKKLLSEFLNFCVALTKETHLSHVVILTRDTIFLNEIYNNAKIKVTSDFKLIDHLPYSEIEICLTFKDLGFKVEDVELIYDYLGGRVAHIKKLIDFVGEYNSLKGQLEEMAEIAKNEIEFSFRELRKKDKEYLMDPFKEIVKDILKYGYSKKATKEYEEAIEFFCEKEILFFDPVKNVATVNSRIYVNIFERI